MTQIRSGNGATAAVLAGSLAVFPLLDVLYLLSRTGHTGELQVVGDGMEAHLWIEGGDLLDHPRTAGDRLFELACLDEAWFTVGVATPPASVTGHRVELVPLIEQVSPHVAEWQSLIKALPFGAVARMAPSMPGPEAQIRSDQWRVLSLIGAGRAVHEVVDVSDARPLETLRLIDELAQEKLITIEEPPSGTQRRRVRPKSADAAPSAEAPSPEVDTPPLPSPPARVVAVRAGSAPQAARRVAAVSAPVSSSQGRREPPGTEPERTPHRALGRSPGRHAVAAYMPPPIAPSLWPLDRPADADSSASDGHDGRDEAAKREPSRRESLAEAVVEGRSAEAVVEGRSQEAVVEGRSAESVVEGRSQAAAAADAEP
jgi:hypothetical protein